MSEHIIIVRKPGLPVVLNDDVPAEWWENVWDLAPVPPRTVDHPAPYPEDLPHRLIRMLTKSGDKVMDPFNGSGATTKAAYDLGRVGIGFDLSQQYVDYAKRRLSEPSSVRENQLRVVPVLASNFTPGKSKGLTRHGAGQNARSKKSVR